MNRSDQNAQYFFISMLTDLIRTRDTGSRFVIGLENLLFCRCVHAHFSPESLTQCGNEGVKEVDFSSVDIIPSTEEWQGSFLRREKCAKVYLSIF